MCIQIHPSSVSKYLGKTRANFTIVSSFVGPGKEHKEEAHTQEKKESGVHEKKESRLQRKQRDQRRRIGHACDGGKASLQAYKWVTARK